MNFILILLSTISFVHCLPINKTDEVPLEIRVLQNPNLYGGDILGIDMKSIHFRNAIPDPNKLWPMGIIPYRIDGSLADKKQMIMDAMNDYHEHTCIRFVEQKDQYDYINIAKGNGCYSYVGRQGGQQLVSLGDGCHNKGTIVHELGHAVGFFHEHQRSDRDDYIVIDWANVRQGLEDQFKILDKSENKLLVNFDFGSIMLYGPLTFSKDSNSKTMQPKEQFKSEVMLEVFQKYGLSKTDITAIQKLYECN